jgi:hypothetical protein
MLGTVAMSHHPHVIPHHIPSAVHPFKVHVPIEGLLFPPIKNPGVVDSIHQRAVLFPEKRDIKVGVKTDTTPYLWSSSQRLQKNPWVASLPKEIKDWEKIFPPSPTST